MFAPDFLGVGTRTRTTRSLPTRKIGRHGRRTITWFANSPWRRGHPGHLVHGGRLRYVTYRAGSRLLHIPRKPQMGDRYEWHHGITCQTPFSRDREFTRLHAVQLQEHLSESSHAITEFPFRDHLLIRHPRPPVQPDGNRGNRNDRRYAAMGE